MGWDGHLNLGPLTIYGDNAMHWAWNLRTRWGWLCARPTTWKTIDGVRYFTRWYLYLSPNATPGRAVWGVGPGFGVDGFVRAGERPMPIRFPPTARQARAVAPMR